MISYKDWHIQVKGSMNKKCILFLHGSGADHEMWNKHIEILKSDFFCIAPDLPGHGKSNYLKWTSIEQVGDELMQLIKSICSSKITIVGFSLGGSLTYYLIEKYPELFEKALIDGASAYPIIGNVVAIQIISPFLKSDFILNMMAKGLGVQKSEYESFKRSFKIADRRSFKRSMIHASKFNLSDKNFAQSIPVLYASGQKESKTMHKSHIELAGLNEKSKCVQYPGKGHAWMMFDMKTHVSMVEKWVIPKDQFSDNKLEILNK
mgnify:CR=1 FL=1